MDHYLRDIGAVVDKPACTWDCETILTTCSNLDNRPAVIAEPPRQRKRQVRRGCGSGWVLVQLRRGAWGSSLCGP
jgi:hypothetical protein